ncbi:hypothetical protein ACFE35_26465 [Phormidesmis priestleyi ANT.L61.2]
MSAVVTGPGKTRFWVEIETLEMLPLMSIALVMNSPTVTENKNYLRKDDFLRSIAS